MPKETIDSIADDRLNRPVPGNPDAVVAEPIAHRLRVQVGWTPAKAPYPMVQVATVAPINQASLLIDQQRRDGFYVRLDRDGINRLIRALRKARNAAFGADA